jgi:tetratricopeptide (TPR) repeat protein
LSNLDDVAGAAAILEEVLAAAERHGYLEVVCQGLLLKANMLWNGSRRREAFAVIEGARKIAEENGMTDDEIEIMSQLANAASEFDMEEGVEATREVMAIARRTGRRDSLMAATANFGYAAFIAGLWDEALAELEPALADEMAPGHRRVMLNNWADIVACRGENVDEAISEMERLEEGRGARAQLFRLDTKQLAQAARGDFKGASKTYQALLDISPGDANEVTYRCARWELWAGDVDEARRLRASFMETGGYGPLVEARRETVEAGIAAAEGRSVDAISLYRDAMKNWRETHSGWDEALTGIDMALLLNPSDPEVADIIRSTRAILERLRAKPYLDTLDKAVARSNRQKPATTSAAEVAVPTS